VPKMSEKMKIEEVDYPEVFTEFITENKDVQISDELKNKIKQASPDTLLKVVKSIGSYPIKIESVKYYTEEFLIQNF